jgi:signal peptidase I
MFAPGAHAAHPGSVATVDPADDDGLTGGPAKGGGYRWVLEWVVILMAVLLCTVLLRTYVIQSFYIPSPSMVPTLQVGDRIMVNKLSYDLHGVHRGDVVVFKRPPLELQNFPDLVKRVIGLPGESVSTKDGHVYINGVILPEDPGRPVLRDGGQPDGFRGQQVFRADRQVAHRGSGDGRGVAVEPGEGRLTGSRQGDRPTPVGPLAQPLGPPPGTVAR